MPFYFYLPLFPSPSLSLSLLSEYNFLLVFITRAILATAYHKAFIHQLQPSTKVMSNWPSIKMQNIKEREKKRKIEIVQSNSNKIVANLKKNLDDTKLFGRSNRYGTMVFDLERNEYVQFGWKIKWFSKWMKVISACLRAISNRIIWINLRLIGLMCLNLSVILAVVIFLSVLTWVWFGSLFCAFTYSLNIKRVN